MPAPRFYGSSTHKFFLRALLAAICSSGARRMTAARRLSAYWAVWAFVLLAAAPAIAQEAPRDRTAARERPVVEERVSRQTAKSKGELTFDDIKFDIEKGGKFKRSMITESIEALNKKTIQIRGYILPASVFRQSGIEEFVLVRDNMECCFGPGAALYDCIMVYMEKGKTAEFSTRPIAVKGKFEIQEYNYPDSDDHYAIYKLTATEVK
jgi:hypothetical protein